MSHVVLLGDSIFDNHAYVEPEPDVITHLRHHLAHSSTAIQAQLWQSTLLAIDGSMTNDVITRLQDLPQDATHLIISAGGNNALREGTLLMHEPPDGAIATLQRFTEMKALFQRQYRHMMAAVLNLNLPTILCTIYDKCPTKDPILGQLMYSVLPIFNDCISCAAIQAGCPLLDLRLVCDQPEDYSDISPIEPSVQGGEKIAAHIAHILNYHDFAAQHTVVYGRSS